MSERVWVYLVVSSDEQGYTLPEQRRWAEEEAARLGATIDPNGIFEGVASGRDGARTILVELVERLRGIPKADRPGRILMVRLDRVGRMPLDAIATLNDLRKLGVTIRTRTDGDVTFARVIDSVGPIFAALQAGFENEVRADRSRASFVRRRANGLLVASKPPYGVLRGKDGRAEPDPATAPTVRLIFDRWLDGDAPADLVLWLRQNAPPRASVRTGNPLVFKWDLSHVYRMIRCETYRDVVVDAETWDRAQRRQNAAARPSGLRKHVYPFSGLRCSCGARLKPRTNEDPRRQRSTEPLVWYVCASLRHADAPRWRSYREDKIDVAWMEKLRGLSTGKGSWDMEERPPASSREAELLTKRREAAEAKRTRIHQAFEDGTYDGPTFKARSAAIVEEVARIDDRIREIRAEIESYEARLLARAKVAAMMANAAEAYRDGTRAERAEMNAAIFAVFGYPTVADDYRLEFPGEHLSSVV